jgi:hypothetical protein
MALLFRINRKARPPIDLFRTWLAGISVGIDDLIFTSIQVGTHVAISVRGHCRDVKVGSTRRSAVAFCATDVFRDEGMPIADQHPSIFSRLPKTPVNQETRLRTPVGDPMTHQNCDRASESGTDRLPVVPILPALGHRALPNTEGRSRSPAARSGRPLQ